MRVSRLYQAQKLAPGIELSLDQEAAHYLGRVLRLKPGHPVNIFNGEDGEFSATVTAVERRDVRVTLETAVVNQANPGLSIHLGLGLSRGERFDYAIQKSTELGVGEITPLITEFCEVRLNAERQQNRLDHWQRVAISACEQCGRSAVPSINTPDTLSSWLARNPGGVVLDTGATSRLESLQPDRPVHLLVGPEGGFSAAELEMAAANDYQAVQLGPRVLRTETAPVVALALLQYLFGDLGS